MILSIGIDAIEIERFTQWYNYPDISLQRIFSPQEIDYCKQFQSLSAQRFAARFAAREAFFKALSPVFHTLSSHTKPLRFLTSCAAFSLIQNDLQAPLVQVEWHKLNISLPIKVHASLTHTTQLAIANILLEKP